MPRYFVPISIQEFRQKVETTLSVTQELLSSYQVKTYLKSDLKVKFSFENFEYLDSPMGPRELMGYHTLPNGMTLLGLCAGGDWEHPVFFCLYWNGKKIRGYIPTEGNPWNTDTREAFGNDEKKDLKNARKRWPGRFQDAEFIEPDDFDFDFEAIQADIMARITPAPGTTAPTPVLTPRPSLAQRIEALTYYGTGDEGYELFQATTTLCYKMTSLGFTEQASILCMWAEEQAYASAEEWVREGRDLADRSDCAQGYFGDS